jgi:hypothetical protein
MILRAIKMEKYLMLRAAVQKMSPLTGDIGPLSVNIHMSFG